MFAGLNSAFGQPTGDGVPNPYIKQLSTALQNCLPPTVLDEDCAGAVDALHPQPGQPYNYYVETTNTTDDIHWFVVNYAEMTTAGDSLVEILNNMTDARTYIDDGSGDDPYILDSETGVYNILPAAGTGGNNQASVEITWKSFSGLRADDEVILLVAYVMDDAGCTDNIEVFRIVPQFNFTLDMNPLAADGSLIDTLNQRASDCVSPIESADYVPISDVVGEGTLTVDYGENWVYFVVTAANFTHSWMPEFQLNYTGTAEALEVWWTYQSTSNSTDDDDWVQMSEASGIYTSSTPVMHTNTDLTTTPNAIGADDGTGECIVVRVRVDHGTTNENADATQTVTLAVDGVMFDSNAADAASEYTNHDFDDISQEACVAEEFDDYGEYDLTPRPEISNDATNGPEPFEIKTGNTTP